MAPLAVEPVQPAQPVEEPEVVREEALAVEAVFQGDSLIGQLQDYIQKQNGFFNQVKVRQVLKK